MNDGIMSVIYQGEITKDLKRKIGLAGFHEYYSDSSIFMFESDVQISSEDSPELETLNVIFCIDWQFSCFNFDVGFNFGDGFNSVESLSDMNVDACAWLESLKSEKTFLEDPTPLKDIFYKNVRNNKRAFDELIGNVKSLIGAFA